jgi:hypothetical protein
MRLGEKQDSITGMRFGNTRNYVSADSSYVQECVSAYIHFC